MRPPGLIVPCPDAAITVHTDIRRTGEHEESLVRIDPLKSLSGRPRHIISEQIMYLVVSHSSILRIMIKTPVIFPAVGQTAQLPHQRPYRRAGKTFLIAFRSSFLTVFALIPVICRHLSGCDTAAILVLQEIFQHIFQLRQTLFGIEDRRLIHVVPEALNALIGQNAILITKPFPCLLIQHIRKMRIPGPHRRHEIAAVLSLAEITVLHTLLVNVVAFLHLHPCVNDRDQPDIPVLHLLHKRRKILEVLLI